MNLKKSSKKYLSKLQELDQLCKNQIQTPRVKKSTSVTQSKYLQLQLQTSTKKKECLYKVMLQKDNRIAQLDYQVKQHKHLIAQTIQKWKRLNGQFQTKSKQCEHLKIELDLIKQSQSNLMKQKLVQFKNTQENSKTVFSQNVALKDQNNNLRAELKAIQQNYSKLKHKRAEQKQQWKKVVPQFIKQVQILKKQFSKLHPNQIN